MNLCRRRNVAGSPMEKPCREREHSMRRIRQINNHREHRIATIVMKTEVAEATVAVEVIEQRKPWGHRAP